MMPMGRSVRDHCDRVRNSDRCTMRSNCNNMIMPSDGCCPICGMVVNVVLSCCKVSLRIQNRAYLNQYHTNFK